VTNSDGDIYYLREKACKVYGHIIKTWRVVVPRGMEIKGRKSDLEVGVKSGVELVPVTNTYTRFMKQ
jgi:hypothetical protein